MQKKIIALAVAGLSATAFAQSNVTVYGVADATFDVISISSGSTAARNINYNRVSTNSSLIGFKGSEDLGGGLSAVFQFESGVGFDNLGALGATRDSFVGVAGGFGTVILGNITGPTRAFGGAVDVNDGATGTGSNAAIIGKLGNVLTGRLDTTQTGGGATAQVTNTIARSSIQASAFDTRFANAIAYVSPTFGGGFTVIGGYVANEGKNDAAGSVNNASAYDLGLKYANGPILVGLSHADVRLDNATDTVAKNTRLVASYDLGVASVRALYDRTSADTNANLNVDQNVWGLGVVYKVTATGNLLAQYYRAQDVKGSAGLGAGSSTGAKFWELGYEHNLSKRTMLKASYTRLDNDTNASYDLGINSTGLTGLASGNNGATISAFQVGVRHKF